MSKKYKNKYITKPRYKKLTTSKINSKRNESELRMIDAVGKYVNLVKKGKGVGMGGGHSRFIYNIKL